MRHSSTEICRICCMIGVGFICCASVPAGQLPGDVKVTVTWFPWQQLQSRIFVGRKEGMTFNHFLILRTTKSLKLGNFYIVTIIVSIPEMVLFMCIFCFVCCVSQILSKRKAIEDFPKSKACGRRQGPLQCARPSMGRSKVQGPLDFRTNTSRARQRMQLYQSTQWLIPRCTQ